jgi:hypothetical protein
VKEEDVCDFDTHPSKVISSKVNKIHKFIDRIISIKEVFSYRFLLMDLIMLFPKTLDGT